MGSGTKVVFLAIAIAVLSGAVTWAVHRSQARPSGPKPIVWDRETCAECHMVISDRHYAAQLQTEAGEVFDFDDPGCLMTYIAHSHPRVHAIYFRHSRQNRWMDYRASAFLRSANSPMGRGYEAVDPGTRQSISFDQALQAVASVKPSLQER